MRMKGTDRRMVQKTEGKEIKREKERRS